MLTPRAWNESLMMTEGGMSRSFLSVESALKKRGTNGKVVYIRPKDEIKNVGHFLRKKKRGDSIKKELENAYYKKREEKEEG